MAINVLGHPHLIFLALGPIVESVDRLLAARIVPVDEIADCPSQDPVRRRLADTRLSGHLLDRGIDPARDHAHCRVSAVRRRPTHVPASGDRLDSRRARAHGCRRFRRAVQLVAVRVGALVANWRCFWQGKIRGPTHRSLVSVSQRTSSCWRLSRIWYRVSGASASSSARSSEDSISSRERVVLVIGWAEVVKWEPGGSIPATGLLVAQT